MRGVVAALIVVVVLTTVGAQTGPRDFARGIEVRTDAGGAIFREEP